MNSQKSSKFSNRVKKNWIMFVRRIIEPKVEKDFFKGKVIVLLGVRQVGKKTFVRNLELCVNHDTL